MLALETFESEVQVSDGTASVTLTGKLDETVTATLERDLERALGSNPRRVVLRAERLDSIRALAPGHCSSCARSCRSRASTS